jgi:hypothetical protein
MKIHNILSGLSVVLGALFQVIGVITYLLFWRVDNEPGYRGDPLVFALALGLCGLVFLLFLGGNVGLLVNRAQKAALVAWFLVGLVAALACAISPLVLMLMV